MKSLLLTLARHAVLAAVATSTITALAQTAQPATETLDLATIARIREEGLSRSHVMEYASGLFDGVGSRLTGSPEFERGAQWCISQLKTAGVANAHTESWGDFGMAWTQVGTSLLLTEPSDATLLAQATPWSPATKGEVTASVVLVPMLHSEADFAAWKGKLAGKVILYGEAPKIDPDAKPALVTTDKAALDRLMAYPLDGKGSADYFARIQELLKPLLFQEKVGKFFADEHAVAALRTNMHDSVLEDDTLSTFGWFAYQKDHKQTLPSAVVSADGYGRMARLVEHGVPVTVKLNIQAKFGADHVDGENVIGDIPGTDPALKDQVVMIGGHLDSWIAGTGATDNGAGTIIAMEAMRILKTLGLAPRRTIRIGLWGGEEQGEFGSLGYVRSHLAEVGFSTDPKMKDMPVFAQGPASIMPKADASRFDVYFNVDNGGGRLLGMYAEGSLEAARLFNQWGEPLKDLGFASVSLRGTASTDHTNFDMVGLPGFQFVQDRRDYGSRTHHTNLDTYERLSEPDLKQAATILAIFAWNASQRDAMFPRKAAPDPAMEMKDAAPLKGVYGR
jgi:carboxypeptidase Q